MASKKKQSLGELLCGSPSQTAIQAHARSRQMSSFVNVGTSIKIAVINWSV